MDLLCQPSSGTIAGDLLVPGDKSISHRAVLCASLADGESLIDNFLPGEDTLATVGICRALGVTIDAEATTRLRVHGVGMNGLCAPATDLDCGNAGTAMRLLCGLLAAQPFTSRLTGDASLSRRPMRRVADPLRRMGASITLSDGGHAPITIRGGVLRGIDYTLPVSSAQIKSAILFAGLFASGFTIVRDAGYSRDHSERMLQAFGVSVKVDGDTVTVVRSNGLHPCEVAVPGDMSSAAFPLVAALLASEGEVTLRRVGINPGRCGVIDILRLMGAEIVIDNPAIVNQEPVADIHVRGGASLRGVTIPETMVVRAIDELPVLMMAAACADGETVVRGAAELRVKESDRIEAVADGLRACGITVDTFADGLRVVGGNPVAPTAPIAACGDHRIAMAFATLSIRIDDAYRISGCDAVATSFPQFIAVMNRCGLSLEAV